MAPTSASRVPSSAAVGSSKSRIAGSASSARATPMRRTCPTDTPAPPSVIAVIRPCGSSSRSSPAARRAPATSASVNPVAAEAHVVGDGPAEHRGRLRHPPDLRPPGGGVEVGQVGGGAGRVHHLDHAVDGGGRRPDQSEQDRQDRGLAAARGPDDRSDPPRVDLERGPVDRDPVAERHTQVAHADGRRGGVHVRSTDRRGASASRTSNIRSAAPTPSAAAWKCWPTRRRGR